MSKKTKVIATLMAMCLVISLGVIGILAVRTLNMKIGGNITFNAEGIAFTVGEGKFYEDDATTIYTGISSQTGKMQGFSMDTDTKLTDVSEAIATWTELELGLDNRGDAILKFNVSNDMSDKDLYAVFDITYGENINDNMVITTGLLQEIPAEDNIDVEIKFDILDMELNAGIEDFEISVTFTDKVEVNNSGEVTNNTTPALTNVAYEITDEDSKEVSASMLDSDIAGNVIIPEVVYIDSEPYTVTSIPAGAFDCCSNITSVYIPGTVESIGVGAFDCCDSLMTVQLSHGLKYIESSAFLDCDKISGEVVIPDSVISIENGAFEHAGGFSRFILTLGENVKTIGSGAFDTYGIVNEELVIPNSVTTIGDYAFGDIRSKKIYIPKSVTSIGVAPFVACENVESITVDQQNTKYHSAGNCLIQTSGGKLIQGFACSVIPTDGSVKTIEQEAFSDVGVINLHIPKSVTSIASLAFDYNQDLAKITVDSANSVYSSAGNCLIEISTKKLILGCKNSVIPTDGSVTTIASHAFNSCNIRRLVIPSSVTTIEEYAMWLHGYLVELVVEAQTPPTVEDYIGVDSNCVIRVPASAVNAYKTAPMWSRHAKQIVAI